MDAQNPRIKTLMFPWLAHGHVFPFLQLSKTLSKTDRFHIYFCSTSIILASVKQALSEHNNIDFIQLQLPTLHQLPPHYHTTKNIPPHLMPTLMEAFQMLSPAFAAILSNLSPDLLIYDGFQPWAAKRAAELGIPAVLFATSGAASFSYFHHMHSYGGFDMFPFSELYLHEYQRRDVVALGESIVVSEADDGFAFGIFKLSCEIVLIKSCGAVEEKYLRYLSKLCCKRVVPVGALVGDDVVIDGGGSGDREIIQWLDRKPRSSTLYISFGSENYLSNDQMVEIAKGLEQTNVNFIWTIRSLVIGGEDKDDLLEGFTDRMSERGMVLRGWAPQAAILAHPSVGGFMSHCGWSSIMESVSFGVPMLAVPLKLDQPVNCRVIVAHGIGMEVARDGDGKFDREGVIKAIHEVMGEERGEDMRSRVKEMSKKVKTDEKNAINDTVEELLKVCVKKYNVEVDRVRDDNKSNFVELKS